MCVYDVRCFNVYIICSSLTNGRQPASTGLLLTADWTNPEDEPIMRDACRVVIEEAQAISRRNGTNLPFLYSNYSSRDQDPLASYGAENVRKLKDIAIKYDPDRVFQELQNGGWLISRTHGF